MIISISVEEIHRMLAAKYGMAVADFGLVITRKRGRKIPVMLERLISRLKEEKVFDPNMMTLTISPVKKIEAIRCIRTFYQENGYSCGLNAGKMIAEEWDAFLTYCKKHGLVLTPNDLPWQVKNTP